MIVYVCVFPLKMDVFEIFFILKDFVCVDDSPEFLEVINPLGSRVSALQ